MNNQYVQLFMYYSKLTAFLFYPLKLIRLEKVNRGLPRREIILDAIKSYIYATAKLENELNSFLAGNNLEEINVEVIPQPIPIFKTNEAFLLNVLSKDVASINEVLQTLREIVRFFCIFCGRYIQILF